MIGVTENLTLVIDQLKSACNEAGRSAHEVTLLAVSKRQPVSAMQALAGAGQRHFGENLLQEALDKMPEMAGFPVIWHFIGSIQSNKTRAIAEHFDWVHAVDRLKIARRLNEQRPAGMEPLNVCIQVNIDDEDSKSGVAPGALPDLVGSVSELPNLKLRGLMCLPAIRDDLDEQRRPFARLRELLEQLNDRGYPLDTLSMGMSGDYRAAILEGSTIIRVGTALFGERQPA